jgi:RNA polymerase sigma factor (sigma-70 family)
MARGPIGDILRHLHQLPETPTEQTDGQLLQRFIGQRDEAAFAGLLRRHGRLVWSVCRHRLHHEHDAEDAFQATFLVLARRAAAIRKTESVASWLHGVAYRIARKAVTATANRRRRERRSAAAEAQPPLADLAVRELQALLDEELERLPAKCRAAFVLCCLEGRSRKEAAAELGWSEGTLSCRIAQARRRLQARLVRRGVTLSAALTAGVLWGQAASACVPPALVPPTLKAALLVATGAKASGVVTPSVAALVQKGAGAMTSAKLRLATAVLLAASLVGSVGWVVGQRADEKPEPGRGPQTGASAQPQARSEPHKTDLYGDPLPEQAVVRLGTSRLRTSRYQRFAPNGRRIVLDRADGGLQLFEVPTGKPLAVIRGTDVPGRKEIIGGTLAFTPDGKYLAAVCWEGRCGIWETATGRLVRWFESPFYSIIRCDFSPDGKLLAVGASGAGLDDIKVGVYEVESGKQLFTTPGTNSVFAPDGKSLVTWQGYALSAGRKEQTTRLVAVPTGKVLSELTNTWQLVDFFPPSDGTRFFEVTPGPGWAIRMWDVATGTVQRTFRGPVGGDAGWYRSVYVRHAPGRQELIAVGASPPGIWCWNLETGRKLWQTPLAAQTAYYPELSEDGKVLVISDTAGTVRVVNTATGEERTSFKPAVIGHGTNGQLSPDGKTIATTAGGRVAFWDAASGKLLSEQPGHSAGITAAAFAPDGAKVFTMGRDRTLRAWDAATGKELFRASTEPADCLAVAPEGNALFAGGPNAGTIRVFDVRTGKCERIWRAFAKDVVGLALTGDGKRLIAAGRDRDTADSLVRVIDARTGLPVREFGASAAKIEQLAVRPDGEAVATSHTGQRVCLWDARGKKVVEKTGRGERVSVRELAGKDKEARGGAGGYVTPYRIGSVGVSPDGRWLVYSDQEQGVVIVNARSGREAGRVKLDVFYQNPSIRDDVRDALAFSPDGQTIAWSGVESTAAVFLIEARTAQLSGQLSGDSAPVQHLVFSPDGSRLLSAGPDGSALIWDLTGRHMSSAAGSKASSPVELESCWTDLGSDDAVKAYQAIRTLISTPAESAAFLGTHLQPIAVPDVKRRAGLVGDLDSGAFATREAAMKELTKLGPLVEPDLRTALDKSPSLEARRRIEQLLARLETTGSTSKGEPLRASRAIEVLERIATPEARQLLTKLIAGAPNADQTREAKAALERLAKRRPPSP